MKQYEIAINLSSFFSIQPEINYSEIFKDHKYLKSIKNLSNIINKFIVDNEQNYELNIHIITKIYFKKLLTKKEIIIILNKLNLTLYGDEFIDILQHHYCKSII